VARVTLVQFQLDSRRVAARLQAAHHELVVDVRAEVDACQLGDMLTQTDLACPRIKQAGLWRKLEPFDHEVDDWACSTDLTWEGLKLVLHRGARPLASNSLLGTRNMLSAR